MFVFIFYFLVLISNYAAQSLIGVPGGIRTPDPRLRRAMLYPTELLAHVLAGVAGFEPTNARVKVSCLTAWRHPIILLRERSSRPFLTARYAARKMFVRFSLVLAKKQKGKGARTSY